MGNCLTLYKSYYKSSTGTRTAAVAQQKAVVQVVKMDGKILEFGASILVKDLLVKFPGLGVGLSTKTSECLPLSYELKLGNMYFLFPLLMSPATAHQAAEEISPVFHTEEPSVIKTIKLLITKKQLEDLVSKKISLDVVVPKIKSTTTADSPSAKGWKPGLESIPEGNEFGFSYNNRGTSLLLSM